MSKIGKFGAVLVVLVVMSLATGASFSGATHIVTVENESLTMDIGNTSVVNGSDLAVSFLDNETIVNEDSGQTLADGTDYEWDTSNGTVTWLSSGKTSDGANASIDYAYNGQTERDHEIAGVLHLLGYGLAVTLLLFGAGVVLGWLGDIGGR